MKIVNLKAENVKRIKAIDITPSGPIVEITGPNESGKTSVLDSIFMALAGKKSFPPQPVRAGEEQAVIRVDMGDLIVTRKIDADSNTSLVVEAANGARYPSPQSMLDGLLGALTFDPLEFSRMKPKDQLDTLRKLVKLDVDIDELEALNRADYVNRTEINRVGKSLNEREKVLFVQWNPSITEKPINVSSLFNDMEAADKHNKSIDLSRRQREESAFIIDRKLKEAESLRERAHKLEMEAEVERLALNNLPPLDDPLDVSVFRARIEEAQETNKLVEVGRQLHAIREEIAANDKEAQELTLRMQQRENRKAQAIADAKMPIEGLSFGDGMVLYNNIPFEQCSGAQQLRISMAIAMATNPQLRVLRIKDASLLDENSMQMVKDLATENDYQIWLETVGGTVGIIMEDGHVKEEISSYRKDRSERDEELIKELQEFPVKPETHLFGEFPGDDNENPFN